MADDRVKVSIVCMRCGERFVLKGSRQKGKIDTGFKRCLCDNEKEFDIDVMDS
ncbi:hypothetical protein J31TS4_07770 [Paenibacillus sp. J31TS4]|uniref:hypothetical protein n=1 Tax=Paenibacillus sp. J31TS4 TaxID=2807195 RepID=UPI001B223A23|nr:hypothetical protein [Paenibacillus sp. J31TS4]GIP37497.1 hypothetical protein J31TS4_07770 [Paenibacillus sp. J31TS4]